MTCYHPLKAWSPASKVDGGRFVFDATKALNPDNPTKLPCGQCVGCRGDRSQAWAIRCHHEASIASSSCFITLTYDDEHVPSDYSVKLRDWQLFMMRLRKRFGSGIRFFGCGEYGEQGLRPHYHALLFNFDFPDKTFYSKRQGHRVFKSEALSELWPFGLSEIGSVTIQSAGYCSEYVQKKITGKRADDHYFRVSPIDGQVHRVAPEFATMSRRPGIGTEWFERFASDAFPSDFLVVDGRKMKPPAFYLRRLSEGAPAPEAPFFSPPPEVSQEGVRRKRRRAAAASSVRENSTPARLAVREVVKLSRRSRLVRSL